MRQSAESVTVEDGPAPVGTGLVLKALNLIDLIAAFPGQHRAQTLADELGLPRSTVYRILNTLQQRGMVRLDAGSQGYFPGFKFLDYAQAVWPAADLPILALTEVRALQDLTGEAVFFAVAGGTDMIIIQKADNPLAARPSSALGARRPLHCTAMGKAYLAALPPGEREALIGKLSFERLTPRTVVDPAHLRSQLDVFRLRGYAIDDEEFALGARCVSAAVEVDGNGPIGALAISGPGFRMTQDRAHQFGPEIAAAARRLGDALRRRAGAGRPGQVALPLLTEARSFVGRSPLWDAGSRTLVWLDTLAPALMQANASAPASVLARFGSPAPVLCRSGAGWLVGTADGAFMVESSGRSTPVIPHVPPELLARSAGLVAAERGPWLAGGDAQNGPAPGLYSLGPERADLAAPLPGTPGGLATPDNGRTLYVSVIETGEILSFSSDGDSLDKGRRTLRIDPLHGRPTALTFDGDGFLWIALWDGWSLARLRPDGSDMRLLPLPVPRPTGIAFGGPAGDVLYVTSSRMGLSPQQLFEAPASGGVFAIDRALRAHLLR